MICPCVCPKSPGYLCLQLKCQTAEGGGKYCNAGAWMIKLWSRRNVKPKEARGEHRFRSNSWSNTQLLNECLLLVILAMCLCIYAMHTAVLWRFTAYPQGLMLLISKVLVFQTGFITKKQLRFHGLESNHQPWDIVEKGGSWHGLRFLPPGASVKQAPGGSPGPLQCLRLSTASYPCCSVIAQLLACKWPSPGMWYLAASLWGSRKAVWS